MELNLGQWLLYWLLCAVVGLIVGKSLICWSERR
jgi:hypothetical protein